MPTTVLLTPEVEPNHLRTGVGYPHETILGLPMGIFSSVSQAAEVVVGLRDHGAAAATVLTCNVDHVMRLRDDTEFRACYEEASLVTADGAPVVWLARLIGRPIGPRVTGAELLPSLGPVCAKHGLRLVVVGGAPGVSDEAVNRLGGRNPRLDTVSVASPGPGFVIGGPKDLEFLARLQATHADVVAVCFGSPKQELWMRHHRDALRGGVLVGAGAAVDFMAGTKKRAPALLQTLGVEWLFRLSGDFRRLWRRYLLCDSAFIGVAAAELWNVRGPGRLRRKSRANK